jgi:hypothetical protein
MRKRFFGFVAALMGAPADCLEANRNHSLSHFHLAAALARLGELGKDPKNERDVERGSEETFGSFADAYLKTILPAEADWKREIEVRCKPIRLKRLGDVMTNDVLAILSPLWMRINRTARETRSRIERVLDAAESKGLRSGKNPAMWNTLKPLVPKAIVLCVDEKPSIQALERAQGNLKLPNGRALTGQTTTTSGMARQRCLRRLKSPPERSSRRIQNAEVRSLAARVCTTQ